MTIAIGILCRGGVVIAADTEIGHEFMKTGRGKIASRQQSSHVDDECFGLVVTGAGNVAYLNHIQKEFLKFTQCDGAAPSVTHIGERAAAYIEDFYAKHVTPFPSYNQHPPDTQVLLAYGNARENTVLWGTENNLLTEYDAYAAIGAGGMYATVLLGQYFSGKCPWPSSINSATLLAAYVLFHVKEIIPGCGKNSDIARLSATEVDYVSRSKVEEMEALFRACSEFQSSLLHQIFGDTDGADMSPMPREVRKLHARAAQLLV